MLEKQDVTRDVLKSVKEDTSAIREDISIARKDTEDELYQKYEYLSLEITDRESSLSEIRQKCCEINHFFIDTLLSMCCAIEGSIVPGLTGC